MVVTSLIGALAKVTPERGPGRNPAAVLFGAHEKRPARLASLGRGEADGRVLTRQRASFQYIAAGPPGLERRVSGGPNWSRPERVRLSTVWWTQSRWGCRPEFEGYAESPRVDLYNGLKG